MDRNSDRGVLQGGHAPLDLYRGGDSESASADERHRGAEAPIWGAKHAERRRRFDPCLAHQSFVPVSGSLSKAITTLTSIETRSMEGSHKSAGE
jgi:hypothetical protein